jgi:hypothetical protein
MMPPDEHCADPKKSAGYVGPNATAPLWRCRIVRAIAVAIAGILVWELGWAWRERSGYEIDVIAQMPAGGNAWEPTFFISGAPVRAKLVIRDGFGESWVRLHDPARTPARPTTILVQGGGADRASPAAIEQAVPLIIRARGHKCTVVVDLRGPRVKAGECVGTDAYQEH